MELPSTIQSNYQSITTVDEPIRYRVSVTTILRRFHNSRKCISSKSAWLLLMLNFNAFFLYFFWPPDFLLKPHQFFQDYVKNGCGLITHFLCPIAGIIADNKVGRHRMIRLSTWILVTGISFSLINVIIIVMTPLLDDKGTCLTVLIQSLLLVLTLVMFILGIAGFEANSIQCGIDQLLDSPWEDQSIFIYWFVWVWTLGYFTYTLHHNLVRVDYSHIDKEKVNKIFSSVILVLLL